VVLESCDQHIPQRSSTDAEMKDDGDELHALLMKFQNHHASPKKYQLPAPFPQEGRQKMASASGSFCAV